MSNIFADYKSGDIDPSSMKPSYKVSEIVNLPFRIDRAKRLNASKSKFSEDPSYIVNAVFEETGVEFVFFAQQKVLFDKIAYLEKLNDEGTDLSDIVFVIRKTETKDGKSYYYDLFDISSQ